MTEGVGRTAARSAGALLLVAVIGTALLTVVYHLTAERIAAEERRVVRQQLARRPALLEGKKVVVWEFVERDIRFGTEGWQVIPLPKDNG